MEKRIRGSHRKKEKKFDEQRKKNEPSENDYYEKKNNSARFKIEKEKVRFTREKITKKMQK